MDRLPLACHIEPKWQTERIWRIMEVCVRLGENGRVVIPAAFRRRLGLRPGDRLTLRLAQDGVVIESRRAAVRAAQRMVRERVPEGELLTDRLFEMRRAESQHD
jgi:AbrB family looped-hinge helix DNA binding protein